MPVGEDKNSQAKLYADQWRKNRKAEIEEVLSTEDLRVVSSFIRKEFPQWIKENDT